MELKPRKSNLQSVIDRLTQLNEAYKDDQLAQIILELIQMESWNHKGVKLW